MLLKKFAFHEPSVESLAAISMLREAFSELHERIDKIAPASREKSLALTELEQSAMWAIKAVVTNDPKSRAHM